MKARVLILSPRVHNDLRAIQASSAQTQASPGDGPGLSDIRTKIANMCLLFAFDVFVLPCKWERLSLMPLEPQAAALTFVTSTNLPERVDVISRLTDHFP